ncbi:Cytochrome bd-I ubiquinol oxidase subunit 2 [Alphaproteobacteria bacterium SO-S41]|nr:Cytochrome bd-I ubiquinol oxidase subunit 2 [Alphaproteobacteria bacterium SO-S41]
MFDDPALWLPFVFAGLMGFSILVYVILDGYDLGVGILFAFADDAEQNRMISSIGPFWDANETWLVLAVGLLLVAFPVAHGMILGALYLPVALLLLGLIMRGVAFEFRIKAHAKWKATWNWTFFAGSLLSALSQGFMLGLYVLGLEASWANIAFACLSAVCVAAGYALLGGAWLIFKTDGALQKKAANWARVALVATGIGFAAISLATPFASPRIFEKWFAWPQIALLSPLPLAAGACFLGLFVLLGRLPLKDDRYAWAPFATAAGIFIAAFAGLAYSFYPYVVPDQLTIYEAASAPESLMIMLYGALLVVPVIAAYSALSYWIFRGKAAGDLYDH